MVQFICPHCGRETERHDLRPDDVVSVDLGNGMAPALFLQGKARGPGPKERHVDERLACDECWERAGRVPKALGLPHPWSPQAHGAVKQVGTIIGAPMPKE